MRTTLVVAALATLAGPALAQVTPPSSGGGSTNGASSALMTAPTGAFAPAAKAAGAGQSGAYTGTQTGNPGHTAGTPPKGTDMPGGSQAGRGGATRP